MRDECCVNDRNVARGGLLVWCSECCLWQITNHESRITNHESRITFT